MGLTQQSTGFSSLRELFEVNVNSPDDIVIALAGNPNTGKSTIFNSLTGLNQHTGNWPGKTVTNAQGIYYHKRKKFVVIDLPGTYSLFPNSVEEEVARDFICFGKPKVVVVILDATCLERNLNLAIQILELCHNVVLCVNLIDEAERKGIKIDLEKLSLELGVPVVGTNARDGIGLNELKNTIYDIAFGNIAGNPIEITYDDAIENAVKILEPTIEEVMNGRINIRWLALRILEEDNNLLSALTLYLKCSFADNKAFKAQFINVKKQFNINTETMRESIVEKIIKKGEEITSKVVSFTSNHYNLLDRKIDNIVTSKTFGIPIMLAFLALIFWITIKGANYPSHVLAAGFDYLQQHLAVLFLTWGVPDWVYGITIHGIYKTLAWVVSVMLPPMAIFFPMFTLLEDLGYLPRIAFNLDNFFKKACAHGKQALTMCMGFGCNAAGVMGCRIIDSPRERLIAILTNNFVPCNGRFPTLILISSIFIAYNFGSWQSIIAAFMVMVLVLFGVFITLCVSKLLSKTLLKGLPSSFTLELPPYRKPLLGRIIIRSIFDRTLFVLVRAVFVAAPAGAIIWLMTNTYIGEYSILYRSAMFLDPFARMIGLDGFILMAFILGIPANEIVMPILFMSYTAQSTMVEIADINAVRQLLINNGWTWLTAICTMLFVLNHWPCSTTLLTILKETKSLKWTLISFWLPTLTGICICFILTQMVHLFGLV